MYVFGYMSNNFYSNRLNQIDFASLNELLSPGNDGNGFCGSSQSFHKPEELCSFLDEKASTLDIGKSFYCLHVNCRSISKNFDEMITFLNCIKHEPSIIGVTETWLPDSMSNFLYDIKNFRTLAFFIYPLYHDSWGKLSPSFSVVTAFPHEKFFCSFLLEITIRIYRIEI